MAATAVAGPNQHKAGGSSVRVVFGSTAVEADPRELLEHLDTPTLMKPFLEIPPEDDRPQFLQCLEELQQSLVFLGGIPELECCVREREEGRRLLDAAAEMLHKDSLALVAANCIRLPKDSYMKILCRKIPLPPEGGEKEGEGAQGAQVAPPPPTAGKLPTPLPELVPSLTLETVDTSVQLLVACGKTKEVLEAYVAQRQEWQVKLVTEFGLPALLAEDVGTAKWEKLEDMIGMWNEMLRLLTSLSSMEDSLASQALGSVPEVERKQAVASVSLHWLKPLLGIGTAVTEGKRSPEKMVSLLDMTETLLEAQAMCRQLSLAGPMAAVEALLETVRACVRETAEEFKRLIVEDDSDSQQHQQQLMQQQMQQQQQQQEGHDASMPSGKGHRRIKGLFITSNKSTKGPKGPEDASDTQRPPSVSGSSSDGDVQKITKYVANFVHFLMHRDLPYVALLRPTLGSLESICEWLQGIMSALLTNLENKASAMADENLQQLFLMNNKNYIVGKMENEESAAKEMLGKKWSEEMRTQLESHRDTYISFVLLPFDIILTADRDREISLFHNRVAAFNNTFDELCQKQWQWRVHSPELRAFIKSEQAGSIVPRYRDFLNTHRQFTQGSRSAKVKFLTAAEVESRIMESFPEKERRR